MAGRNQRLRRFSRYSPSIVQPSGAMANDPIHEGFLKPDITIGVLTFEPFVSENLLAFGGKLGQEKRTFQKIGYRLLLSHNASVARAPRNFTANRRSQ